MYCPHNLGQFKIVAQAIPDKISKVILNTILSTTAVVYLAYIFSQLAYITKAFAFLLPDNYSAAEFARSGFFQMAVIAFINFVILFLCAALVKKTESRKIPTSTKSLLIFLCLFTIFYISTAFVKMMKYISMYGLTRLRVLTSVFMLMLASIFIIILFKLFFARLKYIKAIIIVCTITMISVSVVDINTVIANYNYDAYKSGKISNIDVEQIGSLGVSGLPVLVKLTEETGETQNNAYYEIINLSYSIYTNGLVSFYNSEPEEYDELRSCNEINTSVFQKNIVKKNGKEALDKFITENPDFNLEEVYEDYYVDNYYDYDDDDGWY